MKISVKSAIRATAQMMGIAEDVNNYLDGDSSEEGKRNADLLLEAFNHVENELALDYLPLMAEEELLTSTGSVQYAELSHPATRIFCVEDAKGRSLSYKLFPDRLQTQTGKIKVIYSYSPTPKNMDGESDYHTVVSERLFVYGMAAEYTFVEGELEASSTWDKKYKDAIAAVYKARQVKRLRSRRWV